MRRRVEFLLISVLTVAATGAVEGPIMEEQLIDAVDNALGRFEIALAPEGGMLILRPEGATPSAPQTGSKVLAPLTAAQPVYGEDRWETRVGHWTPPFAFA